MRKINLYFTLGELISLEDVTIEPNSSNDLNFKEDIMNKYGFVIEDSSADKLLVLNQLMRYVYSRFYDIYVFKKQFEPYDFRRLEYAPSGAERKSVYRLFINMFNLTAPRYMVLLQQYDNKKADPIGKIVSSSSGKTRFNDTPQDTGDFDDDEHTTNITQSEATTEVDSGSIMERLDSLYRNWRSILRDWTNEFIGLFYVYESED